MQYTKRQVKRGFTLIELICAIAIIGILAGVLVSGKGFAGRIRLRVATKRLVSDMRYAKMLAVTNNNASVRLRFKYDALHRSYTGYKLYDAANMASPLIKNVDLEEHIFIDELRSTFDDNAKTIDFRYNGSVEPACTIVVADRMTGGSEQVTLTIGYTRIMIR